MKHWWLSFVILVAIAKDAAETAQKEKRVSGVFVAKTSAIPFDHHDQTVAETSTNSIAVETSSDTMTAMTATTATTTTTTTTSTTTAAQETEAFDELHNRITQLTNEMSKAIAALTITQQREQRMVKLERRKYDYTKTVEDKLHDVVDNVQNAKRRLSDDTSREQLIQQRLSPMYRTFDLSTRRLQVIRRLLAGAEVGLVHQESIKIPNAFNMDCEKNQWQPAERAFRRRSF